jgi:hypothetical protein
MSDQETSNRAQAMSRAGHTHAEICAALNLTAGGLNKALGRYASRSVQRQMRKDNGHGYAAAIELAENGPQKLAKMARNDRPEITMARELLSQGRSLYEVSKMLRIDAEVLKASLPEWDL